MVLSARLYAALPLALLVALSGCNQSNQPKAPACATVPGEPGLAGGGEWLHAKLLRGPAVLRRASGKHDYDGQLPDVSEHG